MCLYPGLSGTTLKPYLGISEALSDSGYAVFTYDKVEFTYPSAPAPVTFYKLWLPVASAIAYVKTRSDIDKDNIILLGHSEGSGIIPYAAKNDAAIKAIISLAGPRTPIDTMLAYQLLNIARTCNGDTDVAKTQGAQILAYFNMVRQGSYNSSTPAFAGVPAAVWDDYTDVMDSVSINYNLCKKRTLFIGLGNDINVPLSTEYVRFQQEVTDADFYQVPGLNHYLTTANNPQTSQALTDTIAYWLRKNVFPVSASTVKNKNLSIQRSNSETIITSKYIIESASLHNASGATISKDFVKGRQYKLQLRHLSPGIYFLHVVINGTTETITIPVF